MTQQSTTPLNEAHCLITNDHYRNTIIRVCRDCFTRARTHEEFTTMMETVELLINALSDYPNTDQTFIRGAILALHTVGRWTE